MTLAIGSFAYAFVAIAVMRPITGHFAWTFARNEYDQWPTITKKGKRPSGDQWFGAFCLAFLIVTVWPLAVAWLLGERVAPTIGNERLAHLEADRKRLAELEKELDLR